MIVENRGDPIIITNPSTDLSNDMKLVSLNALVSKYTRLVGYPPIVENGEVPILIVNGVENRLAILSVHDVYQINKLYVLFDYTIDITEFYRTTPFDIVFNDDNIHAHVITIDEKKTVNCPICNTPIIVGSGLYYVYRLGNLHFCNHICKEEFERRIRRR